jgi:hypothetical protein
MKKTISLVSVVACVFSLLGMAQAGVRRPTNDDVAKAALVAELPFTETASLKGSTLEPDEVQPSCKSISGSIWYGFSVPSEANVIADLSSTAPSTVAVFEQTSEGLIETACSLGNAAEDVEFKALPERIYVVQVGSAGKKQGTVDLSLRLSEWIDKTIFEQTYHRESEEQHIPVVSVKGEPRESAPSMYDVTFGISQQQPVTFGILTFGLVAQKVEAELARIPASTTTVTLRVAARYDSSQYSCAADNGAGTCYAGTPLKDVNWLTDGDGSRSELVITIQAARNGDVLQERTVTAPSAGQRMGLLP